MPKIRDLGINVIPVTMRPPEIGLGGGRADDEDVTCNNESCNPSGQCVPSCEAASRASSGFNGTGFSPETIAELKRMLRNQIG
jgi:hypothetical protein